VRETVTLTTAQRAAAIDRSGENIALRSGAGCGKTLVLARRFTELLMRRGPSADALDRFVALTFTDKAAIEMAERVRKTLGELAQRGRGPGPGRRLLLKWILRLPEARIGTIHSFCAALLRAQAIEAEIDPDFHVCADEMRLTQMKLAAVEEALGRELESNGRLAGEVLLGAPYNKTLELLLKLLDTRTAWNPRDYESSGQILNRWRQQAAALAQECWEELAADAALRQEIEAVAAIPCQDPTDKLAQHRQELLALIDQMLSSKAPPSPEQLSRLRSAGRVGSNKAWPDGAKEVRHRLNHLVARFEKLRTLTEPIGQADERAAGQLEPADSAGHRRRHRSAARR